MMHCWIAAALLAGSWLFGLDYFYPASTWAWMVSIVVAVVLLGIDARRDSGEEADDSSRVPTAFGLVTILLLLPAVWVAPWPYRAAPLLIAMGVAMRFLPCSICRPAAARCRGQWSLGRGLLAAGVVLLVQALATELYFAATMRSHDLPSPLPDLLAGVAGLLGVDAAADGANVVMRIAGQTHRLGATWELFLDPATLLFLVGGLTLLTRSRLGCQSTSVTEPPSRLPLQQSGGDDGAPASQRNWAWFGAPGTFVLVVLLWLPLRAGLLMALYWHRVLRTDPSEPLHAMNHFFSPWLLLALLAVPVLLAWRFVRVPALPAAPRPETSRDVRPSPFSVLLVVLGMAMLTAAVYWRPVGSRHEGRVMVVERHSTWEPTQRPYDTTWFGELSGYNYAGIYAYLEQYYRMSRLLEGDKIDNATLAECDVLVIKTPTTRYGKEEIAAVERFVRRGGGLLLIGDHTNFSKSTTILNDITRPMGFIFRDDLLFSFGESPYKQHYVRPTSPHPAAQHVPWMDFAVSCSIDPGSSDGRAVLANAGLWSMGPEYHHDNYHPFPQHCSAMRYGAFVQAWAARYGDGRALAFADSTIFSNFCTFQPGKAELMRNMVEWLNHGNPSPAPQWCLIVLGLAATAVGLWMARKRCMSDGWPMLLAAAAFGWAVAVTVAVAANARGLPVPERVRPQRRVVIDRNISDAPLSNGPDTLGDGHGYGLLEQWIARLDCHTVREEGAETFSGDVLVVLCPSRSVSEAFCNRVERYVAAGGKLVVIDSPENKKSTANKLLKPFGLSILHDRLRRGKLAMADSPTTVNVEQACEVGGGGPVAKVDRASVAATAAHGRGKVLAIGFGSLWNDTHMGEHWMLDPDPVTQERYDALFGLLRPFFAGKLQAGLKTSRMPDIEPPPELKEFGPAN